MKGREKEVYLTSGRQVSEDGYLEAIVVNETPEDIWFDDFKVMSSTSSIVQESHYDCWELELTGIGFQYMGRTEREELVP